MNESLSVKNLPALLEEFRSLRAEILLRIQLRSQLLAFAITSFGAIIALTANSTFPKEVLFVYPLLAFFIACEWTYHDLRVLRIASYIKQIEGEVGGLGWEHHLDAIRERRIFRGTTVATGGIFVCASALSLGLALGDLDNLSFKYGGWLYVFIGVDGVSIIGSIIALRFRGTDTTDIKHKIVTPS